MEKFISPFIGYILSATEDVIVVYVPDSCPSDIKDGNGVCIDPPQGCNQGMGPGDGDDGGDGGGDGPNACGGGGPGAGSGGGFGLGRDGPGKGLGNPINVTNGNKFQRETDYAGIPQAHGVRLVRYYNSQSPTKGLFGVGWSTKWEQAVFTNTGVTSAYIQTTSGRGNLFSGSGAGSWPIVHLGKPTLTQEVDGTWTYVNELDQTLTFDTAGVVQTIHEIDGRRYTLGYSSGKLNTVTDSYGATLTFAYTGDLVQSVTTPDGVYKYEYDGNDNLTTVIYPDDTAGTDVDNPRRTYHYEETGFPNALTGITDEESRRIATWDYDANGRAFSYYQGTMPNQVNEYTFNYSEINNATDPRVTVTNPKGRDMVYHYKTYFAINKITQVDGLISTNCPADVESATYDPITGWLDTATDKAGNITDYGFYTDTARYALPSSRVEALGQTPEERTYSYDWWTGSKLIKQEELAGQWRREYTYYSNNRLQTVKETDLTGNADVVSRTWSFSYTYHDPGTDSVVNRMTVDGPRLLPAVDRTWFDYSSQGYLTKITDAVNNVTEYLSHTGRGRPEQIKDANNAITNLEYTPRGWLDFVMQDVGGINALTDFQYDDAGLLTGITMADGVELDFGYDVVQRMETIDNDLGEQIKFTLDEAGNRDTIEYKDAALITIRDAEYQFDELSRLFKEFGSNSQITSYGWDSSGHLKTIDDGINPVTTQNYDGLNRVKEVIDADLEDVDLVYDDAGRVGQVTDQRDLITSYLHDGFGNLQQITSPDTGITYYNYDSADNRVEMTDGRSIVTSYSYDDLNRLKTVVYPGETPKNVTYEYGNWVFGPVGCNLCKGRLNRIMDSSGTTYFFYDKLGRVNQRWNTVDVPGPTDPTLITGFVYSDAGRLKQITYPGGRVVKFSLDLAGQIDTVSYVADDPNTPLIEEPEIASSVNFEPFGPMNHVTYGNGLVLSRDYDLDGRLHTQTVAGVQDLTYTYYPSLLHNIMGIDDAIDPSRDEDFTYDNLNRLDAASGKYGSMDYDHDEVGNRTKRIKVRGGTTTTETYIYPPTNNRLERIDIQEGVLPLRQRHFLYDGAGNLTDETREDLTHMRPQYDHTNRMDQVDP
jgi:YD repeat-containing protein